jgi:hypothetical protein
MRGSVNLTAGAVIDRRRRIHFEVSLRRVILLVLDFFWSGCYRAGVIEPARKLKLSTIFIAAIAGLVGLGVFFFIGALIASFAAGPLHISTMEGARGYFAALVGIIAGVFGFVGAAWLVLRRRGVRGVRVAVGGIAAFALIIISAASAVGIWYSMQPHVLNRNGPEPLLRLEIRAPENIAIFADATAELTTDRNTVDVILEKPDETATRRGYVPLYYRTSHRLLALKFPNGGARLYNLRLPANPMPKKYHAWSAWQKPDFVDEPGSTGPKRAGDGPDIEVRYHVETADD